MLPADRGDFADLGRQNLGVPELPEVEALAAFLRERLIGRAVDRVDVGAIAVLKTYDPPPTSLNGLTVTAVDRHGKFLDIDVDGVPLVFHLARGGWLRWYDTAPTAMLKPSGKSTIALRVRFTPRLEDDGTDSGEVGFDLTEAGTKKRLAVYVVRDVNEVPGIARLGPDRLAEGFGRDDLARILLGS